MFSSILFLYFQSILIAINFDMCFKLNFLRIGFKFMLHKYYEFNLSKQFHHLNFFFNQYI